MAHHNAYRKQNQMHAIGSIAETDACFYLEKQGLLLIERNYISYNAAGKKSGEIDLVMRDHHVLVFVEVKKRHHEHYGDVMETITPQKRSRIIRAATQYLVEKNQYNSATCRFDVIGITPENHVDPSQKIEWIKNAFEVQYGT